MTPADQSRDKEYLRRGIIAVMEEAKGEIIQYMGGLAIKPLKEQSRGDWKTAFHKVAESAANAQAAAQRWDELHEEQA